MGVCCKKVEEFRDPFYPSLSNTQQDEASFSSKLIAESNPPSPYYLFLSLSLSNHLPLFIFFSVTHNSLSLTDTLSLSLLLPLLLPLFCSFFLLVNHSQIRFSILGFFILTVLSVYLNFVYELYCSRLGLQMMFLFCFCFSYWWVTKNISWENGKEMKEPSLSLYNFPTLTKSKSILSLSLLLNYPPTNGNRQHRNHMR